MKHPLPMVDAATARGRHWTLKNSGGAGVAVDVEGPAAIVRVEHCPSGVTTDLAPGHCIAQARWTRPGAGSVRVSVLDGGSAAVDATIVAGFPEEVATVRLRWGAGAVDVITFTGQVAEPVRVVRAAVRHRAMVSAVA